MLSAYDVMDAKLREGDLTAVYAVWSCAFETALLQAAGTKPAKSNTGRGTPRFVWRTPPWAKAVQQQPDRPGGLDQFSPQGELLVMKRSLMQLSFLAKAHNNSTGQQWYGELCHVWHALLNRFKKQKEAIEAPPGLNMSTAGRESI